MPVRKAAATTAPQSVVVHFTKEKETKGTFRYSEDGDEPMIGTLYVKKPAAEALGNPEKLTVTIEVAV